MSIHGYTGGDSDKASSDYGKQIAKMHAGAFHKVYATREMHNIGDEDLQPISPKEPDYSTMIHLRRKVQCTDTRISIYMVQ